MMAANGRTAEPLPLSPRQIDVLTLAARGLAYREIGQELRLSPHTVKAHVVAILDRLAARNLTHAVYRWFGTDGPPSAPPCTEVHPPSAPPRYVLTGSVEGRLPHAHRAWVCYDCERTMRRRLGLEERWGRRGRIAAAKQRAQAAAREEVAS